MKSRHRSPAPTQRSHADHRHPLKSSPCSKTLKGLVKKAVGEEVCRVPRSMDFDQGQQRVGHQLLE
eukprot:2518736-Alexandrium_andersonii.AAC.1